MPEPTAPPVPSALGALVTAPSGDEMCSYALDVWTDHPTLLTDEVALRALLRAAAAAGGAVVLGEAGHVFPNGAVTASLVLSQSHLAVHTWPEHRLANVDLLTCGVLEGEAIVAAVCAGLAASRTRLTRTMRPVQAPD
ncbi:MULTISPECIES: S-adenosylmethionine decarboxylase [unclassified Nocardioides]|uniref:S-adenosylmethionine decarboxylase n=1 Tax=unclassified Nocardioides TaxID=2615069 RepID=UPI00240724B4|nr:MULTISPECIES: S-adenosylmethionine decarboxylase [unclassified Nocardioides]MDF9716185.1 S-adenosylmethionine decarboxylase [Nocardioides sp. ChNu-99]